MVFPGLVGKIEGYAAEYVWSEAHGAAADSTGPTLQNDSTWGGRGWLTIVYNANDSVIGGKMFQDNASFCPKGSVSEVNKSTHQLIINKGSDYSVFYINGFTCGTKLGSTCYCTVWAPAWKASWQGNTCEARSGEISFKMALIQ